MRAAAVVFAAFAACCTWPRPALARVQLQRSPSESRRSSLGGIRARRRRPGRTVSDVPLVIELLSVCIRAGLPPQSALAAVGDRLPGQLGAVLRDVARSLVVGVPAEAAWSAGVSDVPALNRLAEAMCHAERTGTELVPALSAITTQQRRLLRVTRLRAARRVGVLAALPLGLCFLPAFVLVGVVPLVAGLVQQLPDF